MLITYDIDTTGREHEAGGLTEMAPSGSAFYSHRCVYTGQIDGGGNQGKHDVLRPGDGRAEFLVWLNFQYLACTVEGLPTGPS